MCRAADAVGERHELIGTQHQHSRIVQHTQVFAIDAGEPSYAGHCAEVVTIAQALDGARSVGRRHDLLDQLFVPLVEGLDGLGDLANVLRKVGWVEDSQRRCWLRRGCDQKGGRNTNYTHPTSDLHRSDLSY
jgi:hypothetical protein